MISTNGKSEGGGTVDGRSHWRIVGKTTRNTYLPLGSGMFWHLQNVMMPLLSEKLSPAYIVVVEVVLKHYYSRPTLRTMSSASDKK